MILAYLYKERLDHIHCSQEMNIRPRLQSNGKNQCPLKVFDEEYTATILVHLPYITGVLIHF